MLLSHVPGPWDRGFAVLHASDDCRKRMMTTDRNFLLMPEGIAYLAQLVVYIKEVLQTFSTLKPHLPAHKSPLKPAHKTPLRNTSREQSPSS